MNTSHASLFESGGLHVVGENTLKSLNLVFVFRRLRAVTSLGKLGRGGGYIRVKEARGSCSLGKFWKKVCLKTYFLGFKRYLKQNESVYN